MTASEGRLPALSPTLPPSAYSCILPMWDCYACIHRYHRVLSAHTLNRAWHAHPLSRALSQTTAASHIAERKPSSRLAPWPRRTASSIAIDTKRKLLAKEMQYLGDPLKLATNTLQLLMQPGQDEKARELVRVASKSMECTVSWNHLIDFYMGQGRVAMAMTTYNDVSTRPSEFCQAPPLTRSR